MRIPCRSGVRHNTLITYIAVIFGAVYFVYMFCIPRFVGVDIARTDYFPLMSQFNKREISLGRLVSKLDALGCKTMNDISDVPKRHRSVIEEFLKSDKKLFVASNLHDNEALIPHFVYTLTVLVNILGSEKIYVSVYESGSFDETGPMLAMLDVMLNKLKVKNTIVYNGDMVRKKKQSRIEFLSMLRNMALRPLSDELKGDLSYSHVLFINDVFTCPIHLLELLVQSVVQDADVACGLDYEYSSPYSRNLIKFYDTWVTRGINGVRLFGTLMISGFRSGISRSDDMADKSIELRWRAGNPFQVGCCWNGFVIFKSEVFITEEIVFHRGHNVQMDPGSISQEEVDSFSEKEKSLYAKLSLNQQISSDEKNFQDVELLYSDCSMSEVNQFCHDLRRHKKNKIIIVPKVASAYRSDTMRQFMAEYGNEKDNALHLNVHKEISQTQIITYKSLGKFDECVPIDDKSLTDAVNSRYGWIYLGGGEIEN